jgi:ubiquitin carboxyl-terminal hydrolase L5
MSWCTIESDPGVFTELISSIGVKGVQVDELYDLESKSLDSLKPVYGLIFLFKWQKETDNREVLADEMYPGVFFAKQVVSNACATQAILSVLLNRADLDIGGELSTFKAFTQELPADARGMAIGHCSPIRTAHNSFARPEPFVFDGKKATEDDDVFHFVAYVPVDGQVYELDGLKEGPILLGACTNLDNWTSVASESIKERIARYSAKEIKFNLLALHEKPKTRLERELGLLKSKEAELKAQLTDLARPEDEQASLRQELEGVAPRIAQCQAALSEEEDKLRAWQAENIRRKHNYIPLAFHLLTLLATKGKLTGLVAAATKAQKDRQAAKDKAPKAG